jgi:lipopolysaccharide transport system permease protein
MIASHEEQIPRLDEDTSLPLTTITASARWLDLQLAELFKYRELIGFLVWRDVKVRYKQTTLGVAWAVLQPLFTMIIFSVIFGRIARLPSDGVPYPLFTLVGLLPWQLFSASFTGSANSLVGSAGLITKVYFPRLVVPLATVAGTLVDFAISLVLLLGLLAYYHQLPTAALLWLPLFLLVALGAALGAGLWCSALNVRYRDVQYVLPFLMQALLLASPVAYSATLIKSPLLRTIYALNPMAGVIQGFRWAFLGSPAPGILIWPSIAMTAVLLASGVIFFKKMEASFADVV